MSCGERCCRAWGALTPPLSRKRERERAVPVGRIELNVITNNLMS
jgi:hypothetical protein